MLSSQLRRLAFLPVSSCLSSSTPSLCAPFSVSVQQFEKKERWRESLKDPNLTVEHLFDLMKMNGQTQAHNREMRGLMKEALAPSDGWSSIQAECQNYFDFEEFNGQSVSPIAPTLIQEEVDLCHMLSDHAQDKISSVGTFVEQAGVYFHKQQQQGQQQQQTQKQRKQYRGMVGGGGVGGGRGSEGLEHLSFICALLTKEWSAEQSALVLGGLCSSLPIHSFITFFHSYNTYRRLVTKQHPSQIQPSTEFPEEEAGRLLGLCLSGRMKTTQDIEEALFFYVCGPGRIVLSSDNKTNEHNWKYNFSPYSPQPPLSFSSYNSHYSSPTSPKKHHNKRGRKEKEIGERKGKGDSIEEGEGSVIDFQTTGGCLGAGLGGCGEEWGVGEVENSVVQLTTKVFRFSKYIYPDVEFASADKLYLLSEIIGGYCFHVRDTKKKRFLQELLEASAHRLLLSTDELDVMWQRTQGVISKLEDRHNTGGIVGKAMRRIKFW